MQRTEKPAEANGGHSQRLSTDDLKLTSTTVPESADILARARRTDYVLRVRSMRRDGIVVVQHYANLDAAQRKVRRSHEAGLAADITLCRVTPIVGALELASGDLL